MSSKFTFKKTHHNLYEKQKFNNVYVLLVLLSAEAFFGYLSIIKVFAHKPFIFSTFDYWPLVIFTLLVPTPLLLAYYLLTFETIYNDDGIFYKWYPVGKSYKMMQWDAIRQISMIDLKNAGYMWRFSKEYDKVNYLGGGVGVLIVMRSGKKRLFGTHKAEALNRILIRLAGKNYEPSTIVEEHDYKD